MAGQPDRDRQASVDRFLEYLYNTRWQLFSYHNQKEAFGWGAVVLFVGASSIFIAGESPPLTGKIATTFGIGFALVVSTSFARRQFVLREYAARNVRAFERLILLVIAGKLDSIDLTAQVLPPDLPSQRPKSAKPSLRRRIYPRRLDDDDFANRFNRPPVVVRLMSEYGEKMDDPRPSELEMIAYLVMMATALTSLVGVWI